MTQVQDEFRSLIDDPDTGYVEVRQFLGKLGAAERREAIEGVGGRRRQKRLYELAADGPEFTLEDLVPEQRGPLRPVVFYGKNSLPSFSIFQKRFCRPSEDEKDRLIGYNHQTVSFATGPGYFTVRQSEGDEASLGPVAIDYNLLPDEKPDEWPPIKKNTSRLGRFIYARMIDYLRELADDVFIGRAVKQGKVTDNFFLLARESLGSSN